MAINNPIFIELCNALKPIFPVGAGSAICTVCLQKGIDVTTLTKADIPNIKPALTAYYKQFYSHKMTELESVLKTL